MVKPNTHKQRVELLRALSNGTLSLSSLRDKRGLYLSTDAPPERAALLTLLTGDDGKRFTPQELERIKSQTANPCYIVLSCGSLIDLS